MELLLTGNTKIIESPKKIDIPRQEFQDDNAAPTTITLSQLQATEKYERVKVTVKVLSVGSPVLAGVKNKQDIMVADDTATALVQLWENDVDMMKQDRSYVLNGFLVREYACSKYLSKARNDSSIQEIDNLEDVLHLDTPAEVQQMTDILHGGQVVAVPKLDSIKVCIRCKGRVEPSTPPFGRCSVANLLNAAAV